MKKSDINNINLTVKNSKKIYNILIYIIFFITFALISPIIYKVAFFAISGIKDNNESSIHDSNYVKSISKTYKIIENDIDIIKLYEQSLVPITEKICDSGEIYIFCEPVFKNQDNRILKLLKINTENEYTFYNGAYLNFFYDSIKNENFVYKDYGGGRFFISDKNRACMMDTNSMIVEKTYKLPVEYGIYQSVLSNNENYMAVASKKGFFLYNNSMNEERELISPVVSNNITVIPKDPIWCHSDEYIYYTLYADDYIKTAGRTTLVPGGNEHFTSLENNTFKILSNDNILYYISQNYQTNTQNLFKCGYFNAEEKTMTDMMKSQSYYFNIEISQNGSFIAALSYNGSMIKINIIDIQTKKTIYSSLYDDIYKYSFSPNEEKIIIYGKKDTIDTIRTIYIQKN